MIYGIDEAGRGCLAGPVTAACVSFINYNRSNNNNATNLSNKNKFLSMKNNLADSKMLSPKQREHQAVEIKKLCIWGIGWVYPKEIDAINIHHASLLAMRRAFLASQVYVTKYILKNHPCIKYYPSAILVDGKFSPNFNHIPHCSQDIVLPKIKGDTYIPEIQAASIIAKTARDAYMLFLDATHPQYFLKQHKGYPTAKHKTAIHQHGITYFHRKSFKLYY